MSTLPTSESKTAPVPTDVSTDVPQNKSARMWASGNARIVRYIAIAVVTLIVFYFVSHSRYDGVAIPATMEKSEAWPPAAVADPPVTKESDPKAGDDPAEVLQPETPPSPPESQGGNGNGVENDSKNTIKIKPTTDNEMTPLGMMPNEPGWQTDMMATAPGPRMNATFVTLARNSDVWQIARSIRQVEDRFNKRYNYDWVFLNDEPFDDTFKKVTSGLVSGKTHYGEIPHKHWSFPDHIDQERARKVREDMKARKIIYGDSISYRHMCRFESGFFFWQELMMNYEYYWRVEPSIEMHCDVHYDPFRVMAEKKKKYSFTLSLYEYVETVPTLWESTKKFMKNYPQHIAKDNSMAFLSDDGGENYNLCHFWSNFEVGSLEWLRSQAYTDFFNSLDQDGGFFYERWGDAPVHSIAAGLLLDKSEIHFFNDIAYFHVPFTHCPTGLQTRIDRGCHCDPKDNFDWKGYSCTAKYFDLNGLPKPEGWEEESH